MRIEGLRSPRKRPPPDWSDLPPDARSRAQTRSRSPLAYRHSGSPGATAGEAILGGAQLLGPANASQAWWLCGTGFVRV
jgi:hypothetical protein